MKKIISNINIKIQQNKILKNTLILFSGQSIASLIGIVNTLILINAIGIYGNGILTLVISYANIFNGIFNFQSFNAVIKFGADALEEKNYVKYKKVIKQAFLQDIITAVIAFIAGYVCIGAIARFMMWDNNIILCIKIYLITILVNITGCFTGVLRLHDNFNIIATLSIITTCLKLLLLLLGLVLKRDFVYYVCTEMIVNCITSCVLIYYSICTLKNIKCDNFLKEKVQFDKEFTFFNIYNNIVSTVDLPVGQLVNIIINKFLGVNEVGVYSILVKLGSLILRVTNPLTQALLPEFSKLIAQNNKKRAMSIVKKIFIYTNLLGIIVILILSLASPLWFELFMPLTLKNISLFIIYICYVTFTSSVSGLHLIFISLNLVKYNLPIVLIVNIIYLILVIILGNTLGLFGIIFALIIQALMVVLAKYVMILRKRII